MATHSLDRTLRLAAQRLGADCLGFADLTPVRAFVADQGGAALAGYPSAVSIGVALPHAVVDQLPQRHQRAVAVNYQTHAYDVINQRLDLISSHLTSLIQRQGHAALPIPASKRVDDARLCGAFSHKLAAHMAGLGWIGKSCLLVTPEHGPRVRWATILTTAPLDVAGAPLASRCGRCNLCVTACPVQAFTGRLFAEDEPREQRFDASKCDAYFKTMRKADPEIAVCGMCLYSCPHGQRAAARLTRAASPAGPS